MVTPVVWISTLVMTLPLQAMALALAASRLRDAAPPSAADAAGRRLRIGGSP